MRARPAATRRASTEVDVTGVGTFELLDRAAASGGRARRMLRGPPLSHSDLESLLGSEGAPFQPQQCLAPPALFFYMLW